MKKSVKNGILLLATSVFLSGLVSCASNPKLYDWGSYNDKCYDYSRNPSEWNRKLLVNQFERIMDHQTFGQRKEVPPGIFADYGFFLIQDGETSEGLKYLRMEMELYPESSQFLKKVVAMFEEDEE